MLIYAEIQFLILNVYTEKCPMQEIRIKNDAEKCCFLPILEILPYSIVYLSFDICNTDKHCL